MIVLGIEVPAMKQESVSSGGRRRRRVARRRGRLQRSISMPGSAEVVPKSPPAPTWRPSCRRCGEPARPPGSIVPMPSPSPSAPACQVRSWWSRSGQGVFARLGRAAVCHEPSRRARRGRHPRTWSDARVRGIAGLRRPYPSAACDRSGPAHRRTRHHCRRCGRRRSTKVARLLDLGCPGGPALDHLAVHGDPKAIAFPRGMTGPRDARYDFSFSGLKTAVARYVEKLPETVSRFRSPMWRHRSRRPSPTY